MLLGKDEAAIALVSKPGASPSVMLLSGLPEESRRHNEISTRYAMEIVLLETWNMSNAAQSSRACSVMPSGEVPPQSYKLVHLRAIG